MSVFDPSSSVYYGTSPSHKFAPSGGLRDFYNSQQGGTQVSGIKNLYRGEDLMFGPLGEMKMPHGSNVTLVEDMQGNFHYVPKSIADIQAAQRDNVQAHNAYIQNPGQSLPSGYPSPPMDMSEDQYAWMREGYDAPTFKWGGDRYRGAAGSPGYSQDQFTAWLENATGRNKLETPEGPVNIHQFMGNPDQYGLPDINSEGMWNSYKQYWEDHPVGMGLGHLVGGGILARIGGKLAKGPLPRVVGDMFSTSKAKREGRLNMPDELGSSDTDPKARRNPARWMWDMFWGNPNKYKAATIDPAGEPPPEAGGPIEPTGELPKTPTTGPYAPDGSDPDWDRLLPTGDTNPLTSPELTAARYDVANGSRWAKHVSMLPHDQVPFEAEILKKWPLGFDQTTQLPSNSTGAGDLSHLAGNETAQWRLKSFATQNAILTQIYEQLQDPAIFQSGKVTAAGRDYTFKAGNIASADAMIDDLLDQFATEARMMDADLVGKPEHTGRALFDERNPLFRQEADVRGLHGDKSGRARYISDLLGKRSYVVGEYGNRDLTLGSYSKYHDIDTLNKLYEVKWDQIAGLDGDAKIARNQALHLLDDFFPWDAHLPEKDPRLDPGSNIHKRISGGDSGTDPFNQLRRLATTHPDAKVGWMSSEFSARYLYNMVQAIHLKAEENFVADRMTGKGTPTNPNEITAAVEKFMFPKSSTDSHSRTLKNSMQTNPKYRIRPPTRIKFPVIAP